MKNNKGRYYSPHRTARAATFVIFTAFIDNPKHDRTDGTVRYASDERRSHTDSRDPVELQYLYNPPANERASRRLSPLIINYNSFTHLNKRFVCIIEHIIPSAIVNNRRI